MQASGGGIRCGEAVSSISFPGADVAILRAFSLVPRRSLARQTALCVAPPSSVSNEYCPSLKSLQLSSTALVSYSCYSYN